MAKRLTDNISSGYVAASNRLKPRHASHRIVAYVESYDDVAFWRSVLDEYETEGRHFEIMLPSSTNLGKGKKTALMNRLGKGLGEYMIACVDADYDWLLQGLTPMSDTVCHNPYVLHTYVYAIENYHCYAPSLHQSLVMATLNDHQLMDLEQYLKDYSCLIWPLFVWNIWCYHYGHQGTFSLMDFASAVAPGTVNIARPDRMLDRLRHQVNSKIASLQRQFPQARETYPQVRDRLLAMGLTPETTYLYMHGHSLKDNVVIPLLTPQCTSLRRYREREITRLAAHRTQMQNELSAYQHSQVSLDEALKRSTGYRRSIPFQWLRRDLETLMADIQS